jgi:hypothetical protein
MTCNLCGVRRIKCSLQEDYLFSRLHATFDGDRSAFDREREKVNLRKSKIKKEGLEDVFSLPSAGELAPHTLGDFALYFRPACLLIMPCMFPVSVGESTVIRPQSSLLTGFDID